jgi:hypothetical protein
VVLATLAVASFLAAAWPVAAASTSVSISPATTSVQPGDNFDLDVVINSDTASRGVQFGLTFDPAVVQVTKVTPGGYYQDWAKSHQATASIAIPFKPDNQKGKVSTGGIAILGGPPTDGPTGTGTVLTVSFTGQPGANGTAKIEFVDLQVSSTSAQNIPDVVVTGAVVGVGAAGAAAALQAPSPAVATIAPIPTATPGPNAYVIPPTGLVKAASPAAGGSASPSPARSLAKPASPAAGGKPSPSPASTPAKSNAKSTSPTAAPPRAPSPTALAAAQSTDPAPATSPTAAPGAAAATTPAAAAAAIPAQSPVPTPVPAVAPRGSPGLVIPWEVLGAFGGGVVTTGLVLLALRQAEGGS